MKTKLLLFFLFISTLSYGQNFSLNGNTATFEVPYQDNVLSANVWHQPTDVEEMSGKTADVTFIYYYLDKYNNEEEGGLMTQEVNYDNYGYLDEYFDLNIPLSLFKDGCTDAIRITALVEYEVDGITVTKEAQPPITIEINTYPPVSLTASSNKTICKGTSTSLSANASGGFNSSYTYRWTGGSIDKIGKEITVSPTTTTTYTVTVTDCLDKTSSESVTITVIDNSSKPLPVIAGLSTWTKACPGESEVRRFDITNVSSEVQRYEWSTTYGVVTQEFKDQQGRVTGVEITSYACDDNSNPDKDKVVVKCSAVYPCEIKKTEAKQVDLAEPNCTDLEPVLNDFDWYSACYDDPISYWVEVNNAQSLTASSFSWSLPSFLTITETQTDSQGRNYRVKLTSDGTEQAFSDYTFSCTANYTCQSYTGNATISTKLRVCQDDPNAIYPVLSSSTNGIWYKDCKNINGTTHLIEVTNLTDYARDYTWETNFGTIVDYKLDAQNRKVGVYINDFGFSPNMPIAIIVSCTADYPTIDRTSTIQEPIVFKNCLSRPGASIEEQSSGVELEESRQEGLALYPNPYHASQELKIQYTIQQMGYVKIELDALGQSIGSRILFSGNKAAGSHSLSVKLATLPRGIYSVRMVTSEGIFYQRLVIE